jgi:uncharacterized protein YeaO (DUF488 family)
MTLRVVRLGAPREPGEGPRLGTVRRPPRGVPRNQYASGDWYDVWFPNVAPSAQLLRQAQAAKTARELAAFFKRYRGEMNAPDRRRDLDLLAALSWVADFSVGCYCEDESRCHRSVLRELLEARGAKLRARS